MMAPNTERSPPGPAATATIVDTEAKEMPCTRGSLAPKKGTPRVCSKVAAPLTNKAADTSRPISKPVSPAAPPTIRGGAITPPYMVRMCCNP